jgi:hypothetical protein
MVFDKFIIQMNTMKKQFLFIIYISIGCFRCLGQADPDNQVKDISLENALKEVSTKAASGSNSTGVMVAFSFKDETKGTRYLFPNWVKGSVVDSGSRLFNNPAFLFNYDKMNHGLLLTVDKKNVSEIEKADIESFTLITDQGVPLVFVRIPIINPDVYFQPIGENSGDYAAYRLTTTKFVKANFKSDGMVETGKNYDEYVDNTQYYIVYGNGKEFKKVELTRKSLKKAFADNPKATAYFAQYKSDDVDENYLNYLMRALNQK